MQSIKNNSNKQFHAIDSLIFKTWGSTTSPKIVIVTTLVRLLNKRAWVASISRQIKSNAISIIEITTTNGNIFKIVLKFNNGVLCKTTLSVLNK